MCCIWSWSICMGLFSPWLNMHLEWTNNKWSVVRTWSEATEGAALVWGGGVPPHHYDTQLSWETRPGVCMMWPQKCMRVLTIQVLVWNKMIFKLILSLTGSQWKGCELWAFTNLESNIMPRLCGFSKSDMFPDCGDSVNQIEQSHICSHLIGIFHHLPFNLLTHVESNMECWCLITLSIHVFTFSHSPH